MNTSERKDNLTSTFGDEISSLKKDIEHHTEQQEHNISNNKEVVVLTHTTINLENLAQEITKTTDPLQQLTIHKPITNGPQITTDHHQSTHTITHPNLTIPVQINRESSIISVKNAIKTKPISSRRSSRLEKRGITDQS